MRVAFAWIWPSRLAECSFRFERYLEGFRALGHDPMLVCEKSSWSESFAAWPHQLAAGAETLREPAFWREVGAELVVVVTWHRLTAELGAMRAAGSGVAAFADTDGQIGRRVFARESARREWATHASTTERLRWCRHRLTGRLRQWSRGSFPEDSLAIESTRLSDAVLFGHSSGVREFSRMLEAAGEPGLKSRLHVVPFAVAEPFIEASLAQQRDHRVVAIGRWESVQKNVVLLAEVARRLFSERPGTRIEIFGDGGGATLGPLAERVRTVRLRGPRPFPEVAESLARSRVLLFTSRWEGCPHAALEAMACGCTLVGPPLPSLASWAAEGFGRVAPASAGELTAALLAELEAWDAGERDASRIARVWRDRLAPSEIARGILAAAGVPEEPHSITDRSRTRSSP